MAKTALMQLTRSSLGQPRTRNCTERRKIYVSCPTDAGHVCIRTRCCCTATGQREKRATGARGATADLSPAEICTFLNFDTLRKHPVESRFCEKYLYFTGKNLFRYRGNRSSFIRATSALAEPMRIPAHRFAWTTKTGRNPRS
jgi:hypothetical protein